MKHNNLRLIKYVCLLGLFFVTPSLDAHPALGLTFVIACCLGGSIAHELEQKELIAIRSSADEDRPE